MFELQKGIMNRWKGRGKVSSWVKFSETRTETIIIKNLKVVLKLGMSIETFLKKWSVIYHRIGFENSYSVAIFSKTTAKSFTFKNLKLS